MEMISQTLDNNTEKNNLIVDSVSIQQWLRILLNRNELSVPDGQPLYQYHVTEAEFDQLRNILKRYGEPKHACIDSNWSAAFCIYCAEWYRRKYIGGWSWNGIWQSLNFKIEACHRQYVIQKGLQKYWCRPVSQYSEERNSYLGSVLKEGGLPYALLASDGSRFQHIFKNILSSYEDANAFGLSPTELVSRHLISLPEAFRQETTVKLITNMGKLLLQLTDEYKLDKQDNPASYLDENHLGWRDMFPIPLDGNAGSEFLSGLLTSASNQQRQNKKRDKRIDCQQWLANKSDIEFICKIKLAKKLDMTVERKDLVNSRVEVFVYEGNSVIAEIGIGHINFSNETPQVILGTTACQFTRKKYDQSLYLHVLQAGKVLLREELPCSEIRLGELPIILQENEDHQFFSGSGTCSIRSEQLTVLLSQNANIDTSQVTKVELNNKENIQTISFSGKLGVEINNENEIDKYLITTTASSSKNDLVHVSGDTLPFYLHNGQPIYLGLPKFSTNEVDSQLFIGGVSVGCDYQASIYGVQTVKAKASSGNILYHKRLAILPKDFSIKLVASEQANSGSIELHSSSNFTASLIGTELTVRNVSTDYGKRLALSSIGMPPKEIFLKITPNLLADPVVVSVPFPASGILAYNNDENELPINLTLEDLLGSRVQLFPKLGDQANYKLELSCTFSRQAYYLWEYKVYDHPLEINLYEFRHYIRELLAANGTLDDQVRLEISGPCKTKKYMIGRYSTQATIENSCIKFDTNIENNALIKTVMLDLTDPAARPKPINQRQSQGVSMGVFELPREPENPSLLVPSPDSKLLFRARYIPGRKILENHSEINSLHKATAVYHINHLAIDQVFNQMIIDSNHSGWQFLMDLDTQFGYLPMATFEVWKRLVNRKDMLAALALNSENPIGLMNRLQVEFNVIWELIPLKIWQISVSHYIQAMIDEGYPERIRKKLVANKFEELADISPLFEPECLHLITDQNPQLQASARQILNFTSRGWAQTLTTLHSNDRRWPTAFSNELERWISANYKELVSFTVPMGYQKSTMFFPFFAAAVVAGKAELKSVCNTDEAINDFFLRQLIEFDREWFVPMFKQLLCIIVSEDL